MGAFSNYEENAIIDHMLRGQSFTPPTTVYLGLFTVTPGEDNSGVEVSGGAYARQALTLDAASGGATANTSAITFPTATADWGTVAYFGIYDALTGGNLLMYGALTTSKTIGSGDTFKVNAGDLDITVD